MNYRFVNQEAKQISKILGIPFPDINLCSGPSKIEITNEKLSIWLNEKEDSFDMVYQIACACRYWFLKKNTDTTFDYQLFDSSVFAGSYLMYYHQKLHIKFSNPLDKEMENAVNTALDDNRVQIALYGNKYEGRKLWLDFMKQLDISLLTKNNLCIE